MYISLLLLPCIALVSAYGSCPQQYLEFTPNHSYCLTQNPQCTILNRGVTKDQIKEIVDTHNRLRSKVAMGKEDGALVKLPPASNMKKLEWDDDLAAVAQKWAEQCKFDHDCNKCRKIDNEDVGQNIGIVKSSAALPPQWRGRIEKFYSEVSIYEDDVRSHRSGVAKDGKSFIGHFTQVIWATTARVGCGYVSFTLESPDVKKQLYVCNYREGGNLPGSPVYEVGEPLSACPKKWRTWSRDFPGLCRKT